MARITVTRKNGTMVYATYESVAVARMILDTLERAFRSHATDSVTRRNSSDELSFSTPRGLFVYRAEAVN